jgi:hypothetical protein
MTPHVEGIMTSDVIPKPLRWKKLYLTAMLESDWTKLPVLLDDAINAVLDPGAGHPCGFS